ncbi:ribose transport system substrate-binding protein [Saccharothrix tamanrassetensis]|uniref:Ribose transport system substrate-binding protein n=1 Tax=Saccharothrix tamanrassetensis TaxID=1051531 RepID=A0A841CI56_9PSEU|nr:sugar ABC transporter substrate-binding protein [Saccharothrix tamanrassetensis]MBB5957091.1 ribose transport system substrate-binding protein [Saccharothrix tamanrassetensis]
MRPHRYVAALAVAGLLAGCGTAEPSANAPLKMAFVYATSTQNPFQEMAFGAKAGAADAGNVELALSAPSGVDGPQEVSLFQSAIRNSKDGVALETLTPDLFVRPLNQATDLGVPVVAVDTAPPAGTKVDLFIGNSNTELGKLLGEEFVKQVPENATGQVVLGNAIPGLTLLQQRLDGMKSVIEAKRPGLKISGPFDSGSEPTSNFNKWNDIVKSNPDAIGYLGVGAQDAVSLALIQKNTGRKFLAGSCDPDVSALQAVKDGYVFALASPEHWMKGYVALRLLAEHKRTGKELPKGWWNTGSLVVNAANIDQIMNRQKDEDSRKAAFKAETDKQLADPSKYIRPIGEAN